VIRYAVVGSHGYKASYGGWDQLVNNLVDRKSADVDLMVFNPRETKTVVANTSPPTSIISLPLSAGGVQGIVYDSISIIMSIFRGFHVLLLGPAAMPVLAILKAALLGRPRAVVNIGGIEWERPQFSVIARAYLRLCVWLARRMADVIIIDNKHYQQFFVSGGETDSKTKIIPYGGEIDGSIERPSQAHLERFPFLNEKYFLSISRSIEDNKLHEVCDFFSKSPDLKLVLCSNFSSSAYGNKIFAEYSKRSNIFLVDKLYEKPVVDLLRRRCTAYIHTHTLCGSAPSLIEMIVAQRPIFSIDVPQNRFTLDDSGGFFSDFSELGGLLRSGDLDQFLPKPNLAARYSWIDVVRQYEDCFRK
jgi:hypothetical protein